MGYGTTTVTLDLAAGNRILAEETISGTTLYLHGHDWSTGLIYQDGGYFDPMLGLWLMLALLMVSPKQRKGIIL